MDGKSCSVRQALRPIVAAFGGVIVPAIIHMVVSLVSNANQTTISG